MKAMKAMIGSCLALGALVACGDDRAGSSGVDAGPAVDAGPGPTDDIAFVAGEPLPPGSWLIANDWASTPNRVIALDPADLAGPARTVFSATRVWSMGAHRDGRAILFSANDPMQEAHFGVTFNDSIQNSFVFATAPRTLALLAPAGSGWANVNDECFHPSADGAYVYLCRRYEFAADGSFLGWRLGRSRIADGSFEFLRPEANGGPFELSAQELPGTTRILFELRARPPATGSTLHTRDLVSGVEVMVGEGAGRVNLAPDGRRVLFADRSDQSRLKTLDLEAPGEAPIEVSPTLSAGGAAWSPDGQTIVYTVFDAAHSCDHLERVTWSGTAWSPPTRVRNCTLTGEFLPQLAWITIAP